MSIQPHNGRLVTDAQICGSVFKQETLDACMVSTIDDSNVAHKQTVLTPGGGGGASGACLGSNPK